MRPALRECQRRLVVMLERSAGIAIDGYASGGAVRFLFGNTAQSMPMVIEADLAGGFGVVRTVAHRHGAVGVKWPARFMPRRKCRDEAFSI